jgi:hypothetical protein
MLIAVAGTLEAFWCMMAYFTTFWWYGISIPSIVNTSNTYFQVQPVIGAGMNELATACGLMITCIVMHTQPEGTDADVPPLPGYPDITGSKQQLIFRQAQAAWYLTLVCVQHA